MKGTSVNVQDIPLLNSNYLVRAATNLFSKKVRK